MELVKSKIIKEFTKAHRRKLKELFWYLSANNEKIVGTFGAASVTPAVFLNEYNVEGLRDTRDNQIKENAKEGGRSLWVSDSEKDTRVQLRQYWIDFFNLLEGFKLYQAFLNGLNAAEELTLIEEVKLDIRYSTPKQKKKANAQILKDLRLAKDTFAAAEVNADDLDNPIDNDIFVGFGGPLNGRLPMTNVVIRGNSSRAHTGYGMV